MDVLWGLDEELRAATGAMISVAVLSNIRLYREGLAEILGRQPGLHVVDVEVGDPPDLRDVVRAGPDVIVLDMVMPTSPVLARALVTAAPDVMVVALGVPDSETHVLACAELGIAGYVSREGGVEDLVTVVRRVAGGEAIYPPRIIAALLQRLVNHPPDHDAQPTLDRLTSREFEIVELVDRGLTNKEIATHLCLELATVKNHVHHVLAKLHLRRRGDAARWLRAQRELVAPVDRAAGRGPDPRD
jgi:two-component system, NarL family, nitrate/nitrite response regulator NarL